MEHTTRTQGAMEQNQANSNLAQQGATSPEPSTPTQTKARQSSPEDQGTPELDVNVRYGQNWLYGALTTAPTRAECSMHTSGPTATAQYQPCQTGRSQTRNQPRICPSRQTIVTTELSTAPTAHRVDTRQPRTAPSTASKKQSTASRRYHRYSVGTMQATHNNNRK